MRSSVLAKIVGWFPRLRLIWTDGAYQPVVGWAILLGGWTLELVHKPKELRTFQAAPPVEGRADARVALTAPVV